ncbi:MAG: sulfotransferase [Xanthomonadales bacterium]
MNQIRKVNFAMRLLSQGQVGEAASLSGRLLAESPDAAEVQALACEVAMAQDRAAAALEHIDRAIGLDPEKPEYRLRKAQIQLICRRGLEAQATAAELAARHPGNSEIQLSVARLYGECGNHAGAEAFLQAVPADERNGAEFLSRFATNQFFLGRTESAEQAIADYLALQPPAIGRKLLLRSMLRTQTPDRNHVASLRGFLDGSPPPNEAVNACFALAKELEDLGEHRDSFETLRTGAALQKRLIRYRLTDELANIRGLLETFRPEAFDAIPESGATESPVFIVGLPRTGTTLVERLVTRGGDVRSAEEIYDFTLAFTSVINEYLAANPERGLSPLAAALEVDYGEIARRYLANMRGMLGDASVYLDKTPFNYLYCGLIRKAFPRARIIHMVRDPMDACYAVFKTLFSRAYFYSYDLDDLAAYYVAYRETMDHWHRLMPGAILDVRYEALVSDPLTVSRQIAEFVGIPWSEEMVEIEDSSRACSTASAAQVREPIYTSSIGRWRNVADGMEPVRQRLEAARLVDENGNPTA